MSWETKEAQAQLHAIDENWAGCVNRYIRFGDRLPGTLRPVFEFSRYMTVRLTIEERSKLGHLLAWIQTYAPDDCFDSEWAVDAWRGTEALAA